MKFKTKDEFRDWHRSYITIFNVPAGQEVLKDLIEYAGLLEDSTDPEPFRLGVREGRRQVVMRILRNLHLDLDEVFQVYKGRTITLQQQEEV